MALSGNTVFEVQTGGSDTNGGGFVTGASGTDWSQQASAQYSFADGQSFGTTNFDSATANFGTDVVGNLIRINGGTGSITADWYQIVSRTSATRIVLDRSTGLTTGTGATFKIGGALATPGMLGHATLLGSNVAQQKAWIKSGTYTLTSSTDNISGGLLNIGGFAVGVVIEGYQTTRGDRAARPVISAGSLTGLSNGMIRGAGSRTTKVVNLECDANNGTNNNAFGAGPLFYRCLARNAPAGSNGNGFAGGAALRCTAINCNIGFGGGMQAIFCLADTCIVGFSGGGCFIGSIAKGCTTRGFEASNSRMTNCVAYSCADGYDWTAQLGGPATSTNCISYGNSGFGFRSSANVGGHFLFNCASGGNTSGNFSSCTEEGSITLTADPFTNAAGGDFSLNSAAGGGALLKGAGLPAAPGA
jgi:hypothetical protein